MPSDNPSGSCDVLVAGGGISALSLAWRLRRHGLRVAMACDSDRAGGVIQSIREDGWLLEQGPNSYASFGREERELLEDIGIAGRAQRRVLKTADRFIWHSGRLHKVPTGPGAFLTSSILPAGQRLRLLSGVFGRYDTPADDATLGGFFREVLGDAAVETLLKPAVAGIYAADADRISLDATFPALASGIRQANRLPGALKAMRRASPKDPADGPKALTSFPEGLEEVPRALLDKLGRDDGFVLHTGCRPRLVRGAQLPWTLELPGGAIEGRAVVLCTPAPQTAEILKDVAPEAAKFPATVEHAPLNVVHVGVRLEDLPGDWNGFGFLCRRNEGVRMLGCIWSSSIFEGRAPAGHLLLTCFYGGEIDPEASDLTEDQQRAELLKDLKTTMGYRGREPELLRIRRWKPALPVFRPGHDRRMAAFAEALPEGVHVTSNWCGGVSVPDRIRGAWKIADRLAAPLPHTPARTAS